MNMNFKRTMNASFKKAQLLPVLTPEMVAKAETAAAARATAPRPQNLFAKNNLRPIRPCPERQLLPYVIMIGLGCAAGWLFNGAALLLCAVPLAFPVIQRLARLPA